MLENGQVLKNRYKINAVLGQGGFGAVYKVWDDSLERFCAIKENLQVTAESQKQFKREALMLANLNHPHLVRVTDYFIIPSQGQYLVMDFVEGDDLETLLVKNGGPLPLEQALTWIRQICDALIYTHSQNPPIIHRDIKPANIRINLQGNAVLVDFGLAKVFDQDFNTSIGARGLTPHFAAPEQYGMGGTDVQSDIYSLGVTLYCMLTYRVPPDSVEIMVGNAESPLSAKDINHNIPDIVSNVVQYAMQIRRAERYKSVSDFKNALGQVKITSVEIKSPVNDQVTQTSANSYLKLGLLLAEQNRPQEAEEAIRKAIAADPQNAETHLGLGWFLIEHKRLQEAEESFRKAIIADPNFASAYSSLGLLLVNQKRWNEAEEVYSKAIGAIPHNAHAYFDLGLLFYDQKRWQEAEEAYRKAIIIDVNFAEAYYNLAVLFEEQDRLKEAEDFYRKTIATDPNHIQAYFNLGLLLNEVFRWKEAENIWLKAIEVNPNHAPTYSNLGALFYEQNRPEESEEAFRKAIAFDPSYARSYAGLGLLLKGQKRLDEAYIMFDKAIQLDPSLEQVLNSLK